MSDIDLAGSTGVQRVDDIIRGFIGIVELSFPGYVRAYYVTGSYADGSSVSTSDVDLTLVVKAIQSAEEVERAGQLGRCCQLICDMTLDIYGVDEAQLRRNGDVALKLSSLLMYGDDIRSHIPLPPITTYIRQSMYGPLRFFLRARGNPDRLVYPLGFPDADAEFFGYDRRLMSCEDGKVVPGVKDLVVGAGWAATGLVALKANEYVAKKGDYLNTYRELIGDDWTVLLEDLDSKCRSLWSYLVPEEPKERQQLREICRRALSFENHFLSILRTYMLAELDATDDKIKLAALTRLRRVVFPDSEVLRALQRTAESDDLELQEAARETLRIYQQVQMQEANDK